MPATQQQRKKLEAEQAERAEALRRAELGRSPEGRWLLKLEPMKEVAVVDLVRKHVETPPTEAAAVDRQAFARAVRQLPYFERWLVGKMVDTASIKTSPGTIKARAKRIVADADAELELP